MYSKENVELFLLAREDGMSIKGAAAFAKVNYNAAKDWIYKGLPHSYTGALRKSQCARIQKSAKPSGEKGVSHVSEPLRSSEVRAACRP